MVKKIAVSNQKGGVGKTTVSINVAGALAEGGRKVLLVDLDPQGHGTEGAGMEQCYQQGPPNLYNLLLDMDSGIEVANLIKEGEEFDLLPSNVDMFNAEPELTTAMRGRERLNMVLRDLDGYEFVIVDCPPSLGNLTDNALLACRNLLIPVQAEGSSIRALEILFDQVTTLEEAYGTEIKELAVVANRVEEDNEAKDMMSWLEGTFDERSPIYEVRKRVALKRAYNNGVSIFKHEESCDMEEVFKTVAKYLGEVEVNE